MFVIPGIIALLVYVYVRPQEVVEALRALSFPAVLSFAAFGYLLDVRTGASRPPRMSLLLALGLSFFAWALLTVAVKAPDTLTENLTLFAAPAGMFLIISLGVSTLRAFRVVSRMLLAVSVLLALVAIHQGLSPKVCMVDDANPTAMAGTDTAVGQPCSIRMECVEAGNPSRDYLCEHVGLMGTTSVGGRVRYRGVFQDPNELAWVLSLSLPFAFVWFERRRTGESRAFDYVVVAAVLAVCIVCNIMTKSRSGQLSLVAALGVFFIRRFGWRGVAAGAVAAIPILMLGGRADADSSTQERLECWVEALALWRGNPFFGVGAKQFLQHHYLTAHNSALLTLAEMGPIGLLLFTATVYLAFKIALQAQRDLAGRPEAAAARAAAFAMVAGLAGMVSSALFLSLAYHISLWIMIGLAGAVQAMVLRHDPSWRLRWRWRDTAFVVTLDVVLIAGTAIYLRFKGV